MADTYLYKGNAEFGSVVEERMQAAGYTAVTDAGAAKVVVTYCTNQPALEDAYFDEGGIVQDAQKGTLLVDLSATTPSFARELAAVAGAAGLLFAEAPLVVADPCSEDPFAHKGLACFAAGEKDAMSAAEPVLDILLGTVHKMDEVGAPSMARAAFTLQTVAALAAAAEADALYKAVRRMPAGLGNAAAGNAGAPAPMGASLLHAVQEGRFQGPYTIEMMLGEAAAALSAAEEADLVLPQAEAGMHLLELLAVVGGVDMAPAALSLVYGSQQDVEASGLDWSRAEAAYGEAPAHSHDHNHEDEEWQSLDELGEADEYSFGGYDDASDYQGYGFNEGALYDERDWN